MSGTGSVNKLRKSAALVAGFAASILGLGGLLTIQAPTASAAAITGVYPVRGWATDTTGTTSTPAGTGGNLANGLNAPMIDLNADLLLGGGNYVSVTGGWVGYYTKDGTPPANSVATRIAAGNGGTHTNADTAGGQFLTTLALDANKNGHGDGKPYLYSWAWDSNADQTATTRTNLNTLLGTTVPLGSKDGTNTTGLFYQSIYRWTSGQKIPDVSVLPSARYFEPALAQPNNYWSGGEVVQRTGQIFFSGSECTSLDSSYRMMIWNPVDGTYNYSGKILPATPADDLFTGANACLGQGYVASDMSLDALGNAYLLVQSSQASPTYGVTATVARTWLVRVVPSDTGNWKYNLVQPLMAAPGEPTNSNAYRWAGNGTTSGGSQYMTYGAAFFKGSLYATTNNYTSIVKINPMSGTVSSLPPNAVGGGNPGYVQDLASAETADAIQGTVYNDVTASGSVAGAKGVGGVRLALYFLDPSTHDWVYQGSHNTDPQGNYSFLTGGQGTYAIRVVQPTIGSFDSTLNAYTQTSPVNAWQTYASAGTFPGIDPGSGSDTVTPNCAGATVSVSGPCAGNLTAPVVDPPVPALSAAGTDRSLQIAAIPMVSTVVIGTDQAVAIADFGISASGSFGDAAAGPATVAANAPMHVNSANPPVFLGATAGIYSAPATDGQAHAATDDGLYIGGSALLGNVPIGSTLVLAGGRAYDLKAAVSGPKASSALVNGWVTGVGNNTWGTTAAWLPTVVGGVASGPLTPATSASAGLVQLRAQATIGTLPAQPTNAGREYQSVATSTTQPWTTPGEIEDYQFTVAPAVYRPAVTVNGATIPGPVTVTPQPTITVGGPASFTDITGTPQVGAGVGVAGISTQSLTVTVPTGYTVSARVVDTESGQPKYTNPTVTSPAGPTATVTWGPMAVNDDVTVLLTFQSAPDETKSSLNCTPDGPLAVDGTQPYTCTVTVKDAGGTSLAGQTVDFWSDSTGSPLMFAPANGSAAPAPTATCVTDTTGNCGVPVAVTSVVKGIWNVNASVDTTMAGGSVPASNWKQVADSPWPLTFTAGTPATCTTPGECVCTDPSQTATNLSVDKTAVQIPGAILATAHITDKYCNVVEDGTPVAFAVAGLGTPAGHPTVGSGTTAGTTPSVTVNTTNGNATVTLADATAEQVKLNATINSGQDIDKSPTTVEFTVGGMDSGNSTLACTPTSSATGTPVVPLANGTVATDNWTCVVSPRDGSGNALKNLDVTKFAFTQTTGTATQTSPVVSNGDGTYTVKFYSTKADANNRVSASYDSTPVGNPATQVAIPFKAGAIDGGTICSVNGKTYTVGQVYANPNKTEVSTSSTLTVLLADANCNPIQGGKVAFTVTGAATIPAATNPALSNADGLATSSVTDNVAETVTVGGSYDATTGATSSGLAGDFGSGQLTSDTTSIGGTTGVSMVQFGAGVLSAAKSEFVVSPAVNPTDAGMTGWVTADGSSTYSGEVTARDANGNLLTDLKATDFTYTVTGGNPARVAVTIGAADGQGHYFVTFKTTDADAAYTVTAAYTGAGASGKITGGATVTTWLNGVAAAAGTGGAPIPFQAGAPVGPGPNCTDGRSLSLMSINSASQAAGTPAGITVYLTDKDCNPVKNAAVDFSPTGQAFMIPAAATANTDGTGHATIQVNDFVAQTVTVNATSGTAVLNPVTTTFTAGDPVPGPVTCPAGSSYTQGTTLSANPTTVVLQGSAPGTSTVTALVTDAYCNPVTKPTTVSFATTGASSIDASAQTGADGKATATLTDASAETVTVTGKLADVTGTPTMNPAAGVAVTFETGAFSGANSSFTCVATTSVAGGVPVANGNSTGQDYYTCTIQARDANNAPLPNLTIGGLAFSVTSGSPAAATTKVTPSAVTNKGGGAYTVVFTSTTADPTYAVTASYGGTGNTISGSPTVVPTPIPFTFGPAIPPDPTNPSCSDDRLKTNTAITTNPVTTSPKTQTAGTPASVTTLVTDKNCNPVVGATVDWTVSSNSGTAGVGVPSATTGSAGTATTPLNDLVAEYVSVSAKATGGGVTGQNAGSDSVTFKAGAPVTGPITTCPTPDMTGSNVTAKSPVQVGGTSAVTAKVTDAECNPISGVLVTFSLNPAGDATVSTTPGLVTATTNSLGLATAAVTDKTAEVVGVVATIAQGDLYAPATTDPGVTGWSPTTSASVRFTAGDFSAANSTLTCAVTPGSATPPVADGQQSYTCTMTAKDSNNNGLAGLTGFTYTVSPYIAVSTPVEVDPVAQKGVYTVKLTTTKVDTGYTFGVSYTGIPFGTPQTLVPVPFQAGAAIPPDPANPSCTTGANAGSPKTYSWATPGSTPVGTNSKISTLVTDAFCNPVTGAVVAFTPGPVPPSVTPVSATMSPASFTTGANGIATANETDTVAENTQVSMKVTTTNPTTMTSASTDGGTVNVTFTAGHVDEGQVCDTPDGQIMVGQVYAKPTSTHVGSPANPSGTPAVGSDAYVYLLDHYCNVVPSAVAKFADETTPAGHEQFGSTSVAVDSHGKAATTVTDATAETTTIGGTYVGSVPSDTGNLLAIDVTFGAGDFSAGASTVTVTPGGTMTGGVPSVDGGYYTVTLTARDSGHNLELDLDLTKIVFAANNPAVSITSPVVGHGDGTYTVTYTSTLADQQDGAPIAGVTPLTASVTYDGSAKVGDASGNTDPSIHFVPGEPQVGPIVCSDPTKVGSNFTVSSHSEKVGTTVVLKAYVTDDQCNPVSNVPVTFKADHNGWLLGVGSSWGTPVAGTTWPSQTVVVSTGTGNAWVDMTSYVPETDTVSATINVSGVPTNLNGGTALTASPQDVTFGVGGPVINPSCQAPNTVGTNISAVSPVTMPSTSKVSVLVTDEYCNPLPGVAVNFTVNNHGTLSAATATSGALGVATVQAGDTQEEWVTVQATIPSSDQPTTQVQGTSTRSGDGSGADVQFLAVGTPSIQVPGPGDTVVTAFPPISGTGAVPGDTITVTDAGGNPIPGCDPATSHADGTWSCAPTSPLVTGGGASTVTLTPVQTDSNGNSSSGPGVSFTVDTTPSTITNPTGSTPIGSATPKIEGDGAVPGSSVTVVDKNGRPIPGCNPAAVNADGTWSCTPTAPGLPDGSNQLTPVVTDSNGNTLTGTSVTVVVNTTPPQITGPADGSTVVTGTPPVTGTGGLPGSTVTVTTPDPSDPTQVVTVCSVTIPATATTGAWSCQPTAPLPDGTHELTPTISDADGNAGTPGDPVAVTVDTTPPSITNPPAGSTVVTDEPVLKGNAPDGTTVDVVDDNGDPVPGCAGLTVTGGQWICTPTSPLPPGDQTLTPVAKDGAGGSNPGDPLEVTVDTTPPSIDPMKPTNNPQPEITGQGTVPGDYITVIDEGGSTVCVATVEADLTWSCTAANPLPDGTHKLTAQEMDKGGNSGDPSAPQPVVIDTSVPKPPVPAPTTGAVITGTAQPGMRITVTVPGAGGVAVPVPGCTSVVVDAGGRFACNPSPVLKANTVVTLRAFNAVGTGSLPATLIVGSIPVVVQTGGVSAVWFNAGTLAGGFGLAGLAVAAAAVRRRQGQAG